MGQIKYNKLVRDRIPEIIEASGKNCVTEILSDEDYLCMIDAKLDEELAEYHKDQNIEELADLIEVIYAATKARGHTLEQLEAARAEKAAKRGIFQKKLLLKKVIDPNPNSKILEKIRQNQSAIMEKLNPKVLATYCWLQDNLHKRNVAVDTEYRKKFSGYYQMRFVSQEYRDQFFELFEEIKSESSPSFRVVSQKLFQVDGKHEFSFITKMLHTIEPSRPIYDSQVDIALGIHRYNRLPCPSETARSGRFSNQQLCSWYSSVHLVCCRFFRSLRMWPSMMAACLRILMSPRFSASCALA